MKHFCLVANLILLISCTPENEPSDIDKFTGRWTLNIVELQTDSTSDWEPRQDHYKNRQGFIIYDGKGGMGVHHVTENYEEYEFEGKGGLDSLTIKDLRHLADNFVYFGKYRVIDSLGLWSLILVRPDLDDDIVYRLARAIHLEE